MICFRCRTGTSVWYPALGRVIVLAILMLCLGHGVESATAARRDKLELAAEVRLAHQWANAAFARPRSCCIKAIGCCVAARSGIHR